MASSGSVSLSAAAASMTSPQSASASVGVISSAGSRVPIPGELDQEAEDPSAALASLSMMDAADRAEVAAELQSLFAGSDSALASSFAHSNAQMSSSVVAGGSAAPDREASDASPFVVDSDTDEPPPALVPVLSRTVSSAITSSGQYGGTLSSQDLGVAIPPGAGRLVRSDAMNFVQDPARRAVPSPAAALSDTDEEEMDSMPSADASEPRAQASADGSVKKAPNESDQT